jgi:2'-5' RNA ligase
MKKVPYSLWLLPALPVRNDLAQLIENLSGRLGTPRFEPHVTLAAPVETHEAEIIATTQEIAASLAPLSIRFEGIGQTDAYFRCLFLRAEKRPDLLATHERACARLGRPPEPDFMPHLSLVYGKLTHEVKAALTEDISPRVPSTIVVDRLGICPVVGSVDTWKVLGPFTLTGKRV